MGFEWPEFLQIVPRRLLGVVQLYQGTDTFIYTLKNEYSCTTPPTRLYGPFTATLAIDIPYYSRMLIDEKFAPSPIQLHLRMGGIKYESIE